MRAYISCAFTECRHSPADVWVCVCVCDQQSLIRLLMLFLYFHLSVPELTDRLEIANADYQHRVQPSEPLKLFLNLYVHHSVECFLQPRTVQILIGKAKKIFFIADAFCFEIYWPHDKHPSGRNKNARTTKSLINGTFHVDSKPLFDTSKDPFFFISCIYLFLWLFGIFAGRRSQICDLCAQIRYLPILYIGRRRDHGSDANIPSSLSFVISS